MLMLYFVSFLRFVRLAWSKRESTVVVLIDVDEFTPALSIAWNLTVYVNMIPFWSALRTSFQATKILLKDVSTGLRFNGKPLGPKKKNQKKKIGIAWFSRFYLMLMKIVFFLSFFFFFCLNGEIKSGQNLFTIYVSHQRLQRTRLKDFFPLGNLWLCYRKHESDNIPERTQLKLFPQWVLWEKSLM